jgi:hypothetical protein
MLRLQRVIGLLLVTVSIGTLDIILQANTLTAGQELGSPLYSNNGQYRLAYYFAGWIEGWGLTTLLELAPAPSGKANWYSGYDSLTYYPGTGTHSPQWAPQCYHAVMQGDGNFVCYTNDYSQAVWNTYTTGHDGAYVSVEDNFRLVVYDASNVPIWSVYWPLAAALYTILATCSAVHQVGSLA